MAVLRSQLAGEQAAVQEAQAALEAEAAARQQEAAAAAEKEEMVCVVECAAWDGLLT